MITTQRRRFGACILAASLGLVLSQGALGQVDSADLADFPFRAIGPSATGGRITDIAVQHDRWTTIYAAGASGGLWKTTNNGTTWQCIFEDESSISIGDIALDPRDPDTLWVGTGEANNQRSSYWGTGIFKTTDGGTTWKNMGLRDSHHIGRIVIHPEDSDTVYVAAAGHLYSPNKMRGLYKTTDGGETWKNVLFINEDVGVIDVVVDPKNPDNVYAASYERRRRAWDFDGNGPGSAIHKSTDGGRTWKRLEGGLPDGDIGRIGLDIYPQNPDILYATVANQNMTTADTGQNEAHEMHEQLEFEYHDRFGGVLPGAEDDAEPEPGYAPGQDQQNAREQQSGNRPSDLGFSATIEEGHFKVTEVEEDGPAGRAGLQVGDLILEIDGKAIGDLWQYLAQIASLQEQEAVDLLIERDGEEQTITIERREEQQRRRRPREIGGEIYRTEDGGETWTKMNEQSIGGSPPYYYGQIRVDPTDDQRIYVLSVPTYGSDDGGRTWRSDIASGIHVDHHAMWINPDNPDHILLGNDGGMHVTYDRCDTWDGIFNMSLGQFYAITADMQQPYHVYGGTQDNGSHGGPNHSAGGRGVTRSAWYRVGGGDGFYVCVDPTDNNTIIYESQFGVLGRRYRDTGEAGSIRPPQSDPDGPRDRFNWMSPILMSTHNPQIIYFGGNKLFKSYDQGDSWHVISPDLTTADPEKLAGNVPHCTITTIDESPINPAILLVGTDDGNVQWSRDSGANWTNMADRFPGVPAHWWVSRVILSRYDVDRAYVTFTGYREDDLRPFVFITEDAGATWSNITGDLPSLGSVNVIREDPENEDLLYVGTETGVYFSLDRGEDWVELTEGIPTLPAHDLFVHERDKDLIVGTHGRGMFIMDIGVLQQMTPEAMSADVHLFEPEVATQWRGSVGGSQLPGDRQYIAEDPEPGTAVCYRLASSVGDDDVELVIKDASGEVVRTLDAGGSAGLHSIQWDMRGDPREGDNQRRGRFRRGAPPVAPGSYTVVLSIGGQEYSAPVRVQADPRYAD